MRLHTPQKHPITTVALPAGLGSMRPYMLSSTSCLPRPCQPPGLLLRSRRSTSSSCRENSTVCKVMARRLNRSFGTQCAYHRAIAWCYKGRPALAAWITTTDLCGKQVLLRGLMHCARLIALKCLLDNR